MDFTFEITNQDKLTRFFSVVKTMDFKQLREAIEKVEKDMELLAVNNVRIIGMNDNDIMWDDKNKRIKIRINKSDKEDDPLRSYCDNLGAFNRLVINNCKLETDYREYEDFFKMAIKYIKEDCDGKHPSVMTLIDGLVETLGKRYGVELENFEEIEELQKIDSKRRKMHASLMVRSNEKKQSTGVTPPALKTQQTDIEAR